MSRLFLALTLPADMLAELARIQPRGIVGVRPVRSEQMHVTLHFLGDADSSVVSMALQSMQAPPVPLMIRGVGRFPPRGKPTVLWAGIDASPELRQLHQRLGEVLSGIGFMPETRPYCPHITLARCDHIARQDAIDDFLAAHATFELPPVILTECTLYSSELTPQGPRYTPIVSLPLSATRAT